MRAALSKTLLFGLGLIAVVAGCARPLTPNERALAQEVFGDSFDPDPVRVRIGIGLAALPAQAPSDGRAARLAEKTGQDGGRPAPVSGKDIPNDACDRVATPDAVGWRFPAGFVLGNQVFLVRAAYRPDMFAGWPVALPMAQSLLMAHELVHVWQYQNRARTGFTTLKSGAESFREGDPYYWPDKGHNTLLAFNFEAQATIVEDYLCYSLLLPDHPKRAELAALIGDTLPVTRNFGP
ncbi:hypothetical protein [Aliiroseovarius crassostreae]|uniref:hypothetical protein n=1 Tax=Aliiroseovarius crassostreae TaxID=154981 RepID=UPI002209B863|nr:hypothetical protein [Aliiroseovarius crassostreae]UWQ08455.1 hypothetical protein K3X25_02335 [Aliiroseovarius crassostreae]